MAELRWSPPSRDDDAEWADLLAAMEAVDERGETYELEDLDDEWESVWSHPETDSILVWDDTQLVAFAWLKTIPGERESHRLVCWGGVSPSHRRLGIGTQVLAWSVARASELATSLDPALPTRLIVDVDDRQTDLLAIARAGGFEPTRRFLEIARPTSLPLEPSEAPAGLALVEWSDEIDEVVRLAHVEAFADHWGSEPHTQESWRQWHTGHRHFRPDLSRIVVDEASGEVAALVLSAAYPQDWDTEPVEAWINTVATRRVWRGKGLARWVMTDVLARIAASDTGFERAVLGVDADNPTGALGLYRSLGFDDVRATNALVRAPLA